MAIKTPAQFAAQNPKLKGVQFRDAYWAYRAAAGSPVPGSPQAAPPTATPRPGPAPGTLDAQGREDVDSLTEWRAIEDADITAGLDTAKIDYDDAVRRASQAYDDAMKASMQSFSARGLLRSGLRGAHEGRVTAEDLDTRTRLSRTWGNAQDAARRARERLSNTFTTRERDAYRNSWDRLVAEFNANASSSINPPAPGAPGAPAAPAAPRPQAPPRAVRNTGTARKRPTKPAPKFKVTHVR